MVSSPVDKCIHKGKRGFLQPEMQSSLDLSIRGFGGGSESWKGPVAWSEIGRTSW